MTGTATQFDIEGSQADGLLNMQKFDEIFGSSHSIFSRIDANGERHVVIHRDTDRNGSLRLRSEVVR